MQKDQSAALLGYLKGYVNAANRHEDACLGFYSFGDPVETWLPKRQAWAVRVPLLGPRGGLRTSALDMLKDLDQTVRGYSLAMYGRAYGGFLLVGGGDELVTLEFQ